MKPLSRRSGDDDARRANLEKFKRAWVKLSPVQKRVVWNLICLLEPEKAVRA